MKLTECMNGDTNNSVINERIKGMEINLEKSRKKEYCDVALTAAVVEPIKEFDEPIYCHKAVLESASLYFKKLLASGEPNQMDFIVIDIDRSTLDILVRSIYNCHVGPMDEDNMFKICSGAKLLQLPVNIQSACEDFILNSRRIDNALHIWSFGRKHGIERLSDPDYILKHFTIMTKLEQFEQLASDEVECLVNLNAVRANTIYCPNDMLLTLHEWVLAKSTDEAEVQKRIAVLLALARQIAMDKLDKNIFNKVFMEDPLLTKDPGCIEYRNEYLEEFFRQHQLSKSNIHDHNHDQPGTPSNGHASGAEVERSLRPGKRTRPSTTTPLKKFKKGGLRPFASYNGGGSCVAYFLTKIERDDNQNEENWAINSYDFQTGECRTVSNVPEYRNNGCLLIAKNFLYFIGGENSVGDDSDQIDLYDMTSQQWLDTSNDLLILEEGRSHSNCAVLDDFIYVVAGFRYGSCIDSVERIRIGYPPAKSDPTKKEDDEEDEVTNVNFAKSRSPLVVLDGKIYSVGGEVAESNEGDEKDEKIDAVVSNFVECYDPTINKWTVLHMPMPTARVGHVVLAHQGKLYALGGALSSADNPNDRCDTVEAYDPGTGGWESLCPMTKKRRFGCGVSFGGYIYVMGGESNKKPTAERYDAELDVWEMVDISGSSFPVNAQWTSMVFEVGQAE